MSTWRRLFVAMPRPRGHNNAGAAVGTPSESGKSVPVSVRPDGCLLITVRAKPGAKRSAITDVQDDAVGVAVSAPPVEGEANVELLRYVATVLGIRKSGISLYKGSRSRDKVLCIQTGLLNAETSLQRLRQAAEEA